LFGKSIGMVNKIVKIMITGSAGLIGGEAVDYFCKKGFDVIGIDNDMRKYFFGDKASTNWNIERLQKNHKDFVNYNLDIRDRKMLKKIFRTYNKDIDLIIHTAAQPSHDWAAKEPFTDFDINAVGTLNMLEYCRIYSPDAVFIFTSTNKVYGDTPNKILLYEKAKRWEIDLRHKFVNGIDETMSIDNSKHSLFGASKVAADVLVQEYGKYFNMKTSVFRGGCLTGPTHSGAELHGFLAYLIKCIKEGIKYNILGYKGKQVRDNIHSYDLVNAFYHVYKSPRYGEVYNIGGSRHSNISILEAIEKIEKLTGKKAITEYIPKAREGDHIWYISDVSKFKEHYPKWNYKYDIDMILEEMCK